MPTIKSPYPYQEFKRTSVDGKRLYQNPWGDPVPSVTTILSNTLPAEKRAGLAAWRKRVGEAEAQRITSIAANRGTVMHNILEHWALGEYETYNPGNNIVHRQAKAMAQVVVENIENDIDEIWGTEVNLVAKELYAGTSDLVGVYKGEPTIMDFNPKDVNGLKIISYKVPLMQMHIMKCMALQLTVSLFLCVVVTANGNCLKVDQMNFQNTKTNGHND